MALADLIAELQAAPEGNRNLDVSIAMATGYGREVLDSRGEQRFLWLQADGKQAKSAPSFTTSLQDAHELAQRIFPKRHGGFAYLEDGTGRAILDGARECEAATPALALCASILAALDQDGD